MTRPDPLGAEHARAVAKEISKCKHFTGIQHAACKAGVNYRALIGGPDFGWAKYLPCLSDPEAVICERREYPTPEEAEALVTASDEACAAVLRHLTTGEPLPEGVSYIACRKEDMWP